MHRCRLTGRDVETLGRKGAISNSDGVSTDIGPVHHDAYDEYLRITKRAYELTAARRTAEQEENKPVRPEHVRKLIKKRAKNALEGRIRTQSQAS